MNEQHAMELVQTVLGITPLSAQHMALGHSSVTYDVALPERNVIVRMNQNAVVFAHTEQNIRALAQAGLPVPRVIASDLTMTHFPWPYMIMEKMPGHDLRYELSSMTHTQMTRLAEQIVTFQQRVMMFPQGIGYGFVALGEQGLYSSWYELIKQAVNSTLQIVRQGPLGAEVPNPLEQKPLIEYLKQVPPTCFLDDLTIKNVIVQHGQLQGLVDFDYVCYGDPLYTISLTQTGIVSDVGEQGLFYIEELCRIWNVTKQQKQIINFYSAIHAIDFLQFNFEDGIESHMIWMQRMLQAIYHWLDP